MRWILKPHLFVQYTSDLAATYPDWTIAVVKEGISALDPTWTNSMWIKNPDTGWVVIAGGGFSPTWKDPVALYVDLPVVGNAINDARIVLDPDPIDGMVWAYLCVDDTAPLIADAWQKWIKASLAANTDGIVNGSTVVGFTASDALDQLDSDISAHAGTDTGVHGVGASTVASASDVAGAVSGHAALSTGVHGAGASTLATTANISSHAGLSTGIHGVGASTVASTQNITDHSGTTTGVHGVGGSTVASLVNVNALCEANTYYVAKGGSDAVGVTGSIGTPFLTIQKAVDTIAAAAAGDYTIKVGPGTYAEYILFPAGTHGILIDGGWNPLHNYPATTEISKAASSLGRVEANSKLQFRNLSFCNTGGSAFFVTNGAVDFTGRLQFESCQFPNLTTTVPIFDTTDASTGYLAFVHCYIDFWYGCKGGYIYFQDTNFYQVTMGGTSGPEIVIDGGPEDGNKKELLLSGAATVRIFGTNLTLLDLDDTASVNCYGCGVTKALTEAGTSLGLYGCSSLGTDSTLLGTFNESRDEVVASIVAGDSPYTVPHHVTTVIADPTAGAIIVVLPTDRSTSRSVMVVTAAATTSANSVTVRVGDGALKYIDGALTHVHISPYQTTGYIRRDATNYVTLWKNSTSWNPYGQFGTSVDDGLILGIGSTDNVANRHFIITDLANIAKDHDHDTQDTHPTLFFHSATDPDTDNTQYFKLDYTSLTMGARGAQALDGLGFTITGGAGGTSGDRAGGIVSLVGGAKGNSGTSGYVRIGSAAPGTMTPAVDSLMVGGTSEFDGLMSADGGITVGASAALKSNGYIQGNRVNLTTSMQGAASYTISTVSNGRSLVYYWTDIHAGGTNTLVLSSIRENGNIFIFKDQSGVLDNGKTVVLYDDGVKLLDGATSITMNTPYAWVILFYNSATARWHVIGRGNDTTVAYGGPPARFTKTAQTTDATATTVATMKMTNDEAWMVLVRAVGMQSGCTTRYFTELRGSFYKDGAANIAQEGTTTVLFEEPAGTAYDCDFYLDTANSEIEVQVTGALATTINWKVYVEWMKVTA